MSSKKSSSQVKPDPSKVRPVLSTKTIPLILFALSSVGCLQSAHLQKIEGCTEYTHNQDGKAFCVTCAGSLKLKSDGQACLPCHEKCALCLNATCQRCSPGYYLSNHDCVSCGKNCNSCEGSKCGGCEQGYFFENVGKKCLACDSTCKTCGHNLECLTCHRDLKILSKNGKKYCGKEKVTEEDGGLSTTWIVLIVIFSILLCLICCIGFFCYAKSKFQTKEEVVDREKVQLLGLEDPKKDDDYSHPHFKDQYFNDNSSAATNGQAMNQPYREIYQPPQHFDAQNGNQLNNYQNNGTNFYNQQANLGPTLNQNPNQPGMNPQPSMSRGSFPDSSAGQPFQSREYVRPTLINSSNNSNKPSLTDDEPISFY